MSRLLIAAVKSGSGKTIFTCGLLWLLKEHCEKLHKMTKPQQTSQDEPFAALSGMPFGGISAYKCGPDYIDPMFHKKALDIDGTNLDPFFSDAQELNQILSEDQAEIAVIEGAMGIYDGITGLGRTGSCYEVAEKTNTPIVLVADASGMGATMLSVLKGILLDDEKQLISGLVFNRMSDAWLAMLRPELEALFASLGRKIRILGAVPRSKDLRFESRHLGLLLPDEVEDVLEQIRSYAALIREHVDVKGLLEIAGQAPPKRRKKETLQASLDVQAPFSAGFGKTPEAADGLQTKKNTEEPADCKAPVLGVARDEAFCFYYRQNLKAFTDRGVQICYFSPLHDAHLPEGLDGLLLGGGYPELYLKQLSENETMKADIKRAIEEGLPSLAECGGFMYLHSYIEENGERFPMAGCLPGGVRNTGKLTRFGYVTVTPEREGLLTGPVKGHEFHYYDSDDNGNDCLAEKPGTGHSWACMHMGEDHLWGYPHLYYPSAPGLTEHFAAQMRKYRKDVQTAADSET